MNTQNTTLEPSSLTVETDPKQDALNRNFHLYTVPTIVESSTPDESDDDGLSLAQLKATTNDEVETKTKKVFELHTKVIESLKVSIDSAIECGKELREIKVMLPPKTFTAWCGKNLGGVLSAATYRRYIRLSELVEQNPNIFVNCETITEAYQVGGILTDKKKKGDKPSNGDKDETVNQSEPKKENPTATVDSVKKMVREIQKTIDGEKPFDRQCLIICLEPLVSLYNGLNTEETSDPYQKS
jgi:hypothetical protein